MRLNALRSRQRARPVHGEITQLDSTVAHAVVLARTTRPGSLRHRNDEPVGSTVATHSASVRHDRPSSTPAQEAAHPAPSLAAYQSIRLSTRAITQPQSLDKRQNAEVLRNLRASLAGLMLLGLDMGSVTAREIEVVRSTGGLVALGRVVMEGLAARLTARAQSLCDVARDYSFPAYFSLAPDDLLAVEGMPGSLVIETSSVFPVRLDLNTLPRALAVAVALAIDLVQGMVPMLVGRDVIDFSWCEGERLDFYESLRASGVLERQDIHAVMERLQAGEGPDYGFGEGIDDTQAREIMATAEAWTTPMGEWHQEWRSWRLGSPRQQAELLLRWLWAWRQTAPSLYRHPFAAFIRRTVRAIRRQPSIPRRSKATSPTHWQPSDSIAFEVTTLVTLGEGWAETVIDDTYDYLAQGGEPILMAYSLAPLALRETRASLERMADGYALLALLDHINDQTQNRTSTP